MPAFSSELVWAVHDDIDVAAKVGRRFLDPRFSTGWTEVDADHPKVQAALRRGPAVVADTSSDLPDVHDPNTPDPAGEPDPHETRPPGDL